MTNQEPIEDCGRIVDARGHLCPTPTLRLRRALEDSRARAKVVLIADDPLARIDVAHFVKAEGHVLISVCEQDHALRFTVLKSGSNRPDEAAAERHRLEQSSNGLPRVDRCS